MDRLIHCKTQGMQKLRKGNLLEAFVYFSEAADLVKSCPPWQKAARESEIAAWRFSTASEIEKELKIKKFAMFSMYEAPEIPKWYSKDMEDDAKNVYAGICLSIWGRKYKKIGGASWLSWYCFSLSNFYLEQYLKEQSSNKVIALREANVKELSEFSLIGDGNAAGGGDTEEEAHESENEEPQEEIQEPSTSKVDEGVPINAEVVITIDNERRKPVYSEPRRLSIWETIIETITDALL